MNLRDITFAAPRQPPCMEGFSAWVGYLYTCQRDRQPALQPFADGKFKPEFNFCTDCDAVHAKSMAACGQCRPSVFRAGRNQEPKT